MLRYRKVGGLHFIKVGRCGASFYVRRRLLSACRELVPYRERTRWLDAIGFAAMFVATCVLYLWS